MNMQAANRKSAEIRSRIEPGLKEQSTEVLAALGLDLSGAIRLFLRQVVEVRGLPFDVRRPTAKTVAAMTEAREIATARFGSSKELFDGLKQKAGPDQTRNVAPTPNFSSDDDTVSWKPAERIFSFRCAVRFG